MPHQSSPPLPTMHLTTQKFSDLPEIDLRAAFDKEWAAVKGSLNLKPGAEIAVAVGSRGISNLVQVVGLVAAGLKAAGYSPFITPAMGSHGGATAEGQIHVLKALGVTEASVGAPVRATMEVEPRGRVDGIPLFLDRLAAGAAGIVLINRIKPHTNFIGPTESGLLKMMAIGLGNQIGAEHYHRLSVVRSQYEIISSAGRELINQAQVLFGVALLENQSHRTAGLKIAPAQGIEAMETDLLKQARSCMGSLPLEQIDLLIVDEMGKNISGEGIDPNVVGRDVCAYGAKRPLPVVTRILVRDLTEVSEGSAVGIGQADFTVQRLVDKINFRTTAVNCLTACCPEGGKIPLTYETDEEAVRAALGTLRPYQAEDLRLVHIKNTLELDRISISRGCLAEVADNPNLEIDPAGSELEFDRTGNLISPFVNF